MTSWSPFLILLVGIAVVLGGIVFLRIHAFLALISAALAVSLMAPGGWDEKAPRVVEAFGATAASVGVVISLAAIIGIAMTESGAADRIVRMFLGLMGERHGATALMASGFVVAIPVFFDTVFYLLVPLARSMYRRTGGSYVKYLVAAASCASAHALIPPTPGPLVIASELGIDIGTMMLIGTAVAAPAALASLLFAGWIDKRIEVAPPAEESPADELLLQDAPDDSDLPSIWASLAPIVVPLLLIATKTTVSSAGLELATPLANALQVLGNPNTALLVAAFLALGTLRKNRGRSLQDLARSVEHGLMSGAVIVLITAAGGAFGGMLKIAGLAPAIQDLFGESATRGVGLLLLAFAVAALIKFAQGSSTAAMIVTSGMFAAMTSGVALGFHPVYLGTAIGAGSLVGSWMNDSGFWIFARMGGLSEVQTLQTWTPLLAILGTVSMAMTLLLSMLLPMTPAG
ncbi:Inner membrane permease YgbN [Pseudobythopirellula maris]|uniref:Inner membrane permease YgbN n=1 Tax=Pseudobythopirellula maris TaxID=2527991 RepID=A0A5C5ZT49_9BACT|nr:SLC13 family permease [Pseudobythopirellula maris]TWT90215.1 Inner membrane permease YgbN [Pseudobythopirellula maris]